MKATSETEKLNQIENNLSPYSELIVSRGSRIKSSKLKKISFTEILDEIRGGKHKELIEEIRKEESKDEQTTLKKKLPYFVGSIFEGDIRRIEDFNSSRLFIFD